MTALARCEGAAFDYEGWKWSVKRTADSQWRWKRGCKRATTLRNDENEPRRWQHGGKPVTS